jgi:hypothetical protein
VASAVGVLACGLSHARNADISDHITNLSESAADSAPGLRNYNTEILIVDQTVHTFWMSDHPEGGTQLSYRRSLDGGHTWQEPYTFYQQDLVLRDPLRSNELKRMTVVDGTVHIAFGAYAGEGGGWFGRIVYLRSLDNGVTFEEPRYLWSSNVPDPVPWHAYDVRIASAAGKVAVCARLQANWYDHLSAHVYISSDHGETFSDTVAATGGGGGGWVIDDFQFNGNEMALLYNQSYFYYGLNWRNLYVSASDDGGMTFRQQQISVPSSNGNHMTMGAHDYHYSPKISCAGGRIDVVWLGLDASDTNSIFYRRSPDAGRSWEDAINLTAGTAISSSTLHSQYTLATEGDRIFVLIHTTEAKMFLRRSVDGGLTFDAPVAVTDPAGDSIAAGIWWPAMKLVPSGVTGVTCLDIVGNDLRRFRSIDNGQSFTVTTLGPAWSHRSTDMAQFAGDSNGNTHIISKGAWTWYSTGVFGDPDTLYARIDQEPAPSSGSRALQVVSRRNPGDGSGDERYDGLLVPDDGGLVSREAMTIEFWTKVQLSATNSENYCLQKQGPGRDGSWETILIGNWRSGQADARIATEDAGYVLVGGGTVVDGQWHHIAITYDSRQTDENFRLFVDGSQVAATTASGLLKAGRGPVLIGGGDGNRAEGTVAMDDVRIWDRALDADTIRSGMSRPLTGGEDGLLAWHPLDGSSRDASGNGHHGYFLYKESFVSGVISPVSSLARLELSQGDLTPSFTPETTEYTATVDGSVANITLAPTVADAMATVRVNDVAVPSGTASAPVPLVTGENVLTVKVEAPDGTTVTTYTVTVTREPSADAKLGDLVLSAGALVPNPAPDVLDYSLAVPYRVVDTTVTPMVNHPAATVTVNGTAVASGAESALLPLAVGDNTITVVVTAEDGVTTQTYTLVVNRASPSSVSTLSRLVLGSGTLVPGFSAKITEYMCTVGNGVTSITLTPRLTDLAATVLVNGVPVLSGETSAAVPLPVGASLLTVEVKAQDGTTMTTYTVEVIRKASASATLSRLLIKGGKLSPSFNPKKLRYGALVKAATKAVQIKATATDRNAKLRVNGKVAKSGRLSMPIKLKKKGGTLVRIQVTAQDGSKKTYRVTVRRA